MKTSKHLSLVLACWMGVGLATAQPKIMDNARKAGAATPSTTGQAAGSVSGSLNALTDLACQSLARDRSGSAGSSASLARPLPHDSRLVVFSYDKNALYPVNTWFNLYTHFELEEGERLLGVYINDETEWEQRVVPATRSDILVRPRVRGATGTMTVISDRRRYQISLADVQGCPTETRYQRVSWMHNNQGMYESESPSISARVSSGEINSTNPTNFGQTADQLPGGVIGRSVTGFPSFPLPPTGADSDAMVIRLDQLNTEFTMEGDEELKPETVMEDGKRTWIKFKGNQAQRPAMFAVSPQGDAEAVEYIPRGSYFIAARTFPHGILLKLGKREVKIRNKASSCGWFDATCRNLMGSNISGGQ